MDMTSHLLMPGDTIVAVLKKYNCYTSDENILDELSSHFRELNGDGVFRPGTRVKVPVLVQPDVAIEETNHSNIQKEHQ